MKRSGHYIISFFLLLTAVQGLSQEVPLWDKYEKVFHYTYNGNAFTGVQLSAVFRNKQQSIRVTGFYDGGDRFCIRFMPGMTGEWEFTTSSNIPELNNQKGHFTCGPPAPLTHGPVKVAAQYHFAYADSTPYYPVGTTAYAWNHMNKRLQKITLTSFANSGFNKVRMCVFPKNYDLVKEEPSIYPYERNNQADSTKNKWDFTRFNPAFFTELEQQLERLKKMGIEADLILFHPYDKGRWGFDAMPEQADSLYVAYITARLSSFSHIWWSMANEWDFVKTRSVDQWKKLARQVSDTDPYHHLLSIHGSTATYFDYSMPAITHLSIQDEAPVMNFGAASILRNVFHKPVIYDEVGYEGNLKQRWGRHTAQEMTRLMWMGAIGGTYVTHGDTYQRYPGMDTIFWAKGGYFRGESWKRAAFLRSVLESNKGPLDPADISRDLQTATTGKGVWLIYFGTEVKDSWAFNIPVKNGSFEKPVKGQRFKVQVIDTWNMTITDYPEVFETGEAADYRFTDKDNKKLNFPAKPFLAIRIIRL